MIKFDIRGKRETIGVIWKEEEEAAAIAALKMARAKCYEVERLIGDTNGRTHCPRGEKNVSGKACTEEERFLYY